MYREQSDTSYITCYQPGSTVMKSSVAGVPLKNRFSAVTDTVRFSHAGRLGASTVLVGWSTVALNNTAEVLLLTSTKYLNVGFPPGGIPVALFINAIQEMLAVTGVVSYGVMIADRPLSALGDSALNDRINMALHSHVSSLTV